MTSVGIGGRAGVTGTCTPRELALPNVLPTFPYMRLQLRVIYIRFLVFLNFSNIYVIKLKCSSKKNTSKVICQNSENINTHAVPTSSCKMNEGKKICSIVFGVQ